MLSLRVALRYLFSKKTHNAVNILSLVSVVGVAIATMAMVIVLSVFNGFSDLAAGKLSQMDPDLLIVPESGKIIENADSVAAIAAAVQGVRLSATVLREQAMAVTRDGQMPVTLQGMTVSAVEATNMSGIMLDGSSLVGYIDEPDLPVYGRPACVLSVGVAVETGLRSGMDESLQVYVPRRRGRINTANPMSAFRGDTLVVAGVYRVEQAEYDTDMIVVPLEVARRLLDYTDGEGTAVQVFLTRSDSAPAVARQLSGLLGPGYRVLDRIAQQQQAFNMIAVEKWVTLLMLAFILVITSFNIISAIYILKVEKQGNMAVLRAMGADNSMIQSIFAWQGRLITLAGGAIGILLGTTLTLAQQWGAFIKLQAGDASMLSVEAYPVRLEPTDLLVVAAIVIIVALVCARIATLTKK
ncbi:MAG: ABC transporter permease [Muribaculaceae bacterium]|nr:ABC transporter permease [Muribaculaceae bacterium]